MKLALKATKDGYDDVAPRVGAWIETSMLLECVQLEGGRAPRGRVD